MHPRLREDIKLTDEFDLERFVTAQELVFDEDPGDAALVEGVDGEPAADQIGGDVRLGIGEGPDGTRSGFSASILSMFAEVKALTRGFSRRACAGARDLKQRSIGRVREPDIGVGAPKIPDGAIIGDIALRGGVNFARIW